MSFRYHGRYCGPGWSAGKYQNSVVSDLPGIDEFDETCRVHDARYALGSDLIHADYEFAKANLGKGVKRSVAGAIVGGQWVGRVIANTASRLLPDIASRHTMPNNTNTTKANLRTVKKAVPVNGKPKKQQLAEVSAPAAIGTMMRGSTATSTRTRDGVRLTTTVCIGKTTSGASSTIPSVVGFQQLNPVSLGNDEIQNFARMYQHFRMHNARARYKPQASTSSLGDFIMISDDDPNYRLPNTEAISSFYQKSLSTGASVLTSIWNPVDMMLKVDNRWKVCDNQNSTTLEEFSAGVLFLLVDGNAGQFGFVFIDLDIEFEGLRFNPRAVISGSYQGMAIRLQGTFVNPTIGADAVLTATGFTVGDVYEVLLSTTSAAYGAGITAAGLLVVTSGSGTTAYPILGSNLIYGRAISATQLNLWTTYDGAIGSDVSDKLIYAQTTLTTATLPVCMFAQLRNSSQPT